MYRVGSRIISVGYVELKFQIFGIYLARHINQFECTEEPCVARRIAAHR